MTPIAPLILAIVFVCLVALFMPGCTSTPIDFVNTVYGRSSQEVPWAAYYEFCGSPSNADHVLCE